MEMMRIGILGVAGVMLALQFKSSRPEISIYIGLTAGLIIFYYTMTELAQFMDTLFFWKQYINGDERFFNLLLKAIGITYIGEFCASVCKDAGYGALAGQIEIFAKLAVLFMGIPLLTAVVENISALAGQ